MKNKKFKNYNYSWQEFSGVDTMSGKMEVFMIVADKRLRKPIGWNVGYIEQLKDDRWLHFYYRDPVIPTFWERVKYIFTGKPNGFYRASPITFEGQKFIK